MDLPPPIQAFFDGNARLDATTMLAPFASDAIVRDEARIHRGTGAIRAWIDRNSIGLPAIALPAAVRSEGDRHEVRARVSGNFPGSPIDLAFRFRLHDGAIAELEIH